VRTPRGRQRQLLLCEANVLRTTTVEQRWRWFSVTHEYAAWEIRLSSACERSGGGNAFFFRLPIVRLMRARGDSGIRFVMYLPGF
jgi:hypothetical protein